MTIPQGLPVALFIILMVFALLVSILGLLKLSSSIIRLFEGRRQKKPVSVSSDENHKEDHVDEEKDVFSSGVLKLRNVDEATAAMIVAIVSEESGIPMNELIFKSIRLVETGDTKTSAQEVAI
ncbi:MAG: hypothetical protein JW780_00380 [Clostridiales bacterium]|nr:hypothetical protein [Clostridiales bacterium]